MWTWLKRYADLTGWTPFVVLLALAAWVVLGALDPRVGPDRIGLLLDLPIVAAHALVAAGLAKLTWRRWSFRLTDEQMAVYLEGLLEGKRGPLVVYVVNAIFYLAVLTLYVAFLWVAR